MKSVSQMTSAELREAAHAAIIRELGVAGLMRYVREQSLGSGDYTRDRHELLPKYESIDELFDDVRETARRMRERGEIK